ncbi:hypothetical protein M407DRAFT_20310 [Tulasnella calospora MUT 4182]|uniref:Uncharacterized protein n=1 Tax=Tulasnella calospora MUT 4182 TaxID=1051891 RepID=A0A0C3QG73_9AGAM|nr:hypothetical protein M407DRAFT_20310 [Tulasnella calospora MUT 4182]
MSSAHGPLEALLTPDDGSIGAPMTDKAAAALLNHNPIVWISFAGGSNEPVAPFIQSVQRVAFQQNRIKDDEWIAELASSCFTDQALVWYLGLGKETQSSWAKLRIALAQQYLVQAPAQAPKPSPAKTALLPKAAQQPKPASPAITDTGRIEVLLPEFGDRFGFLSQDSTGEFVVDPNPENALKLQKVLYTDSIHQQLKIYSLRFVNGADPRFPFLGLKLVKLPGEDPDVVPESNPSSVPWKASGSREFQDYSVSVPACCKSARFPSANPARQGTTPYATWNFVQTTESKRGPYYIRKAEGPDQKDRVVSAVWTITGPVKDVAELGLTWPKGDKSHAGSISEIRLDAILHTGGIAGLHVHPYNFVEGTRQYLAERHVVRFCIQTSLRLLDLSLTRNFRVARYSLVVIDRTC